MELEGRAARKTSDLLADYARCSARRQLAILRFAHKLAELEAPQHTAEIFEFPPK